MPEHSGTDRPAGRTARTREAVHRAVGELLADPMAEVTMATVAARSGVHRTTLYRRWRTAESIVLDFAVERVTEESPVPATGDLRADLTEYVHRLLTTLQRTGTSSLLQALLAAAAQTNDAVEIGDIMEPRVRQFQAMLDAAEVRRLDGSQLVDLVLAPSYLWAQFGAPLDPDAGTQRIVDAVLAVAQWKH
ncbi:TetR/AcrR family transcriptional regulator [Arthrobacter cryoconiti]|uniref:TetR/AcrR family transcriptional regulator n=1 Tax=Arthrobacter cryoconiti TaxID=748907 RepID=A0ABV8R1U9_9MICC|nr:TetR/AcrR family transcriptional regulator C-terminal ligand-binding domain-containing protein [Arthrobacter cryoconiti]MCC9067772.1 TetR/AcrR family transcriptional regulator C-terminal ligand-binding domain-containing protein [Arthrobacter cryoconiti]